MELKDYIRVIRRRLGWFITVMAVVLGGYLAIATITEKKVYFARVDLYITETRTSGLFEGLRDYFPNTNKMSAETRIETLKSKEIAELAALYLCNARHGTEGDYLFAAERKSADSMKGKSREAMLLAYQEQHKGMSKEQIQKTYGDEIERKLDEQRTMDPKTKRWTPPETMGKWQEHYVKAIASSIDRRYGVERPDKTQLVRITVQSDSPGKAVGIANALCEASIYYNREFDNRELEEAQKTAKGKIRENQEELSKRRAELKEYWKNRGVAEDSFYSSDKFFQQILNLRTDIEKLKGELGKKDEEQEKLDKVRQMEREKFPDFSFPKDSLLSQLLNQRSVEEKNLEGLLTRYTEAHPDVRKSRHTIEELKQQYAEALRKFQENDARDYSRNKAIVEIEKDFLKEEVQRKKKVLDDLEAHRLTVDQLRVDEQEMTSLIQHLENENKRLTNFVSLAELYADSAAKPVDRFRSQDLDPSRDAWEESTDVLGMMWFMFVVAFLLSIGVVFLVEYMDTTLKTEHDIRRHLNLPVLGIIHHQREGDSVLLTELGTKDAFAEKFYTAATIIKSAANDLGLRTFVVSSTVPKEGKTTITVNLGVALARKGLKVIVIDSDLRIPQIHELLGLDNAYGLSSILEGRLKAKEVLADITDPGAVKKAGIQSFLQETTVENLRVLTSGPPPPDPISLLESTRMKALIEELKGMADFVLFDTPPLANVGDTLTLAGLADANIFVVGAGAVEQHQVAWAKHLLSNIEANVLGCFLNHAVIEGRSYYYYYNEYKSYRARG